ncbi:hypothetical protein LTR78_005336 [Recurvomyces mirabilis]|uniref:Uncharacterized protein n=1 Tax=Recurvomyces mirabilis TaxID=574656 RepID=A0AAE0WMS3_9PEZI|nr:hypothetical protein LTR78_005336 [Recurvomyces mirabilis]KAK5152758.1 39S ribosomal protein L16, mitochondrial [Recurvomyces mirabilis]
MASPSSFPQSPPYTPDTASVGGVPNKTLDVPVTAAFLSIYVCLAATNMIIFRLNRRRNHKFIMSGLLAGFCNVRTITCSLRIAWAFNLDNVNLVIAAEILFDAGILLIYFINVVFAQRILRAKHPDIGWNHRLSVALKSVYAVIGFVLVMTISTIILGFYTLDQHTLNVCRDIYLFATSYLLFFATLPVVFLLSAYLPNRSPNAEQFGRGTTERKALVLLGTSSLGILIAGFRAGTTYMTPRSIKSPAWYDSKASFYCFGFVPEILILTLFVITRVDLLFKVPDNSSKIRSFGQPGTLDSHDDPTKSVQAGESM